MSKLFNFLAYGVGVGFTLYTLYDRVYFQDGALNITFKLALSIVAFILWRKFHKYIGQKAQIQKGDKLIYVDRFPIGKSLYMFGMIIGVLYFMSSFFAYVENKEIPISYTFELLTVAWLLALGLKLISVYFEKRKKHKLTMLEKKETTIK